MRFDSANARHFAAKALEKRRYNTSRRNARIDDAEHIRLSSSQSRTYIEDRLINLRSQLLKLDKLIGKCRDSKRLKDIAIAAKFLNDQERALVRPMTIAEAKEVAKAAKAKPPSNDGI